MYPVLVFPSTVLGCIELTALPIFICFLKPALQKISIMQRVCLFLVCHIVFKSKWTIAVCSICPTAQHRKTRPEMLPVLRMGVQGPL
jgi:hypothetical protein